jgi:hypothetical protein
MLAVPFLLVFTAGLAAAVYSMLQGVTPAPAARTTTRLGMITAPSVAAFAVLFGAIGYLCTTRTLLSYPIVVLLAFVGGGSTIAVSAPLLARLARSDTAHPAGEIEIEGELATVVRTVSHSVPGEITFQREGRQLRQPALNLIAGELNPGREVVIDRIANGVAYVEDWASVEKRL